ncbi:MAG: CapA family protein [Clostridia bacterium]|nr:CapA family protein [Clostridia bacterium]
MKYSRVAKFIFIFILGFSVLFSGCCHKPSEDASVDFVVEKNETISILAAGDILLHMPVINSGKKDDGSYDFSPIFEKLRPEIRNADIAAIGQETVFGGNEMGYSGYPLFNSPSDMGKTLVNEGFDVVLHASNHVLDKLGKGVENTLDFWRDYPQIAVLGINESEMDKNTIDIIEEKGAKIALLNYTYGTNGIPLPEGKEYLVNLIDEDKINSDCRYAEDNADFTIAFMHWGTEYASYPDDFQKNLAQKMCDWGVDLIIGSHPHVIQPVEWIQSENGNRMLVYYSLGNFVSRQKEARNLLGALAKVNLLYDGESVGISEYSFVPIVTHYNRDYNEFTVYRLAEYDDGLAALHGVAPHDGDVSVERFRNMVDMTFDGYDKSIIKY